METQTVATTLTGRLSALNAAALVNIHNEVAPKPVQKFSDKTMAVRRTELALQMAGKDYDGAKIIDAAPPASETVATAPAAAPAAAPAQPAKRGRKASAEKLEQVVKEAKEKKERRKVNQLGAMKFPIQVGIERQVRKMNSVKGRVWEDVTVTLPDGSTVPGKTEAKNGLNFYFTYEGVLLWAKKAYYPNYSLVTSTPSA